MTWGQRNPECAQQIVGIGVKAEDEAARLRAELEGERANVKRLEAIIEEQQDAPVARQWAAVAEARVANLELRIAALETKKPDAELTTFVDLGGNGAPSSDADK